MRSLVVALLVSSLFSAAHAIVCRDTWTFNATKTCEGDYCIAMGKKLQLPWFSNRTEPVIEDFGCLSGPAFARFNNHCWATGRQSICVCDTSNCTDTVVLPLTRPGKLKCADKRIGEPWMYPSEGCYGCQYTYTDNGYLNSKSYGCSELAMQSISDLLRPQSCIRIQTGASQNSVHCSCDTEDYCSEKLSREQSLKSDKVTCYVNSYAPGTCTGDLCFVEQPIYGYSYDTKLKQTRGCLTSNDTLHAGLFQTGYARSINSKFVICNLTLCNKDLNSAINSLSGMENNMDAGDLTAYVLGLAFALSIRNIFISEEEH